MPKHKLIADFRITQKPNDLGELDNMALRAKKLFGGKDFEALADKGYYKAGDLKKCVENGITPYVTKQMYSNGTADKDFYNDKEVGRAHYFLTKKRLLSLQRCLSL